MIPFTHHLLDTLELSVVTAAVDNKDRSKQRAFDLNRDAVLMVINALRTNTLPETASALTGAIALIVAFHDDRKASTKNMLDSFNRNVDEWDKAMKEVGVKS